MALSFAILILSACGDGSTAPPDGAACQGVLCDRPALDALGLDPFYQKYVAAAGIPVISSEKVLDSALLQAKEIIEEMLAHRPEIREVMVANDAYVGVMARTEVTTDIPEHRHLANDPNTDWDKRARGLGGTPNNPITTAGEENLLCLSQDTYRGENILVHEFAHAIHLIGIELWEPTFRELLEARYEDALGLGLWVDTYAASNAREYWAEGVQSWLDANQAPFPGIHNEINTREELKLYDPGLAALIESYLGDLEWRPGCPGE